MTAQKNTRRIISHFFKRNPVADLVSLKSALSTTSRTTVFRALSQVGYLSSYSHAGRYYTLKDIPVFDDDGLWANGAVLFSKHRTLRSTLVHLVEAAPAGRTHAELQTRVRLRVHDTLHNLVESNQIGRVEFERCYLYLSADRSTADVQFFERKRLKTEPSVAPMPDPTLVIDVLLAVIHHPDKDAAAVASLLRKQAKPIVREQIEAVFAHYSLGKKKTDSRRSQS